jgi:hypothetical protein
MLVVMMMLCQLPDRKYDTVEEAVRGRGNDKNFFMSRGRRNSFPLNLSST